MASNLFSKSAAGDGGAEGEATRLLPGTAEDALAPEDAREAPAFRVGDDSPWDDIRNLREGSIPQSAVVAVAVGAVCGVACYLYYVAMEFLLEFVWRTVPEAHVADAWPEWSHALYIPLVGFVASTGLGLSVALLGEPGDLAYTIECVHKKAFVHLNHVAPMCVASMFGIVGGASLGPEAPLVAICAALGGNISFYLFRQTNKNVMRKHTLMGMAAALAAFFGAPLGGSLFALEVCSKFGIEYFEHTIESIFCGLLSLVFFRFCTGIPAGPIWTFPSPPLEDAETGLVLVAAAIGVAGALVAFVFMNLHWQVLAWYQSLGLLTDTKRAVQRAWLGGAVIYTVGMLVPQTLFWGEAEFETLWNLRPAATLEHVWPTAGLVGFEMDTLGGCLVVGFAKLVAISFSVAGGFRGGFIFPLFAAGAAFGRAVVFLFPSIPPTVACLSFAAGINVAVTKTAMATTIILAYLSGEQNSQPPVLAASIASLLVSSYMPFIKTQFSREDEAQQAEAKKKKKAAALGRFKGAALKVIHAKRLFHVKVEEVEEDDVPLSQTDPSFRHHSSRSYLV